jgi:hypothetical protein
LKVKFRLFTKAVALPAGNGLNPSESIVYNTSVKMIGSIQGAEEICQDTFLRVFHKLHQFEGRAAFKTWLFRIVYNFSITNALSTAARKIRLPQQRYLTHSNCPGKKNEKSPCRYLIFWSADCSPLSPKALPIEGRWDWGCIFAG